MLRRKEESPLPKARRMGRTSGCKPPGGEEVKQRIVALST